MSETQIHIDEPQLEQGLSDVLASPRDAGPLTAIFVRPKKNERRQLGAAELSPEGGIAGDRWAVNHWQKLPDGRPDPQSQISLMNARMLRLVAGSESRECEAGDNLVVDLDLSAENLPAGSRLRIGNSVVLEITSESHTGCGKFSRRYGLQARDFVNSPFGKSLNLRGRYAFVVQGGTIQVGDAVAKVVNAP